MAYNCTDFLKIQMFLFKTKTSVLLRVFLERNLLQFVFIIAFHLI